ncbi:aminotransferase class I/II-fold pyridoxal phosphate-dependent enzyme [Sediminitomix flava]|uniref:7-keto-8-aminopelargonate synthetase-like enzyme n=1 Tax=Sediminitomix flava TaxID=379075 RepID=A0A315ZJQ0_SEDFL|nr:aminotransferase class I/II-fold pyridoxal phosphate-dependent enzyme [Sediminitomix flava]PWJ34131.1 7-keto-8-aminopelargonate synthetase-like enzyme [Sediminitomix flava]
MNKVLLESTYASVKALVDQQLAQHIVDTPALDGRLIHINGREVLHFGSCSYLGLEMDERLKEASINAIKQFGTQFSSSRSFTGLKLYQEAEDLLQQIYQKPVLLAPTTTLGHMSALPVVVGTKDAIILDHQVHMSVKNAAQISKADNTHVELVRHNNLELLEERIIELQKTHELVWYMADGIYSMYGDGAPAKELMALLDKYERFRLYVDDAHGFSWAGENGKGYFMSKVEEHHPHLFLTGSMAKSFASAGGVIVLQDEKQKELVQNCGSTFIFSGPIQPSVLAASIESLKLHLTNEITVHQNALMERMKHFVACANKYALPLVSEELSPIFYVGVGSPQVCRKICNKLMENGFYVNPAVFPAVPMQRSGLRITITNHHTMEDIEGLMHTISVELDQALAEEGGTREKIFKTFKLPQPVTL